MKNLILITLFTTSLVCLSQEDNNFKNNYAFLTEADLSKDHVEDLVRDFRQHIFTEVNNKFDLKFQYSKDGKLELHSNISIRQEVFDEFFDSHEYEISLFDPQQTATLTERSSF
tara:strand:+ start:24751 stop:25092 length:342 start_codon:yes stop_codon:yes gene_type:complete